MYNGINKIAISQTRYDGLGYAHITDGLWMFVDLDGEAQIGPQYKAKAELLADMQRYGDSWSGITA